MANLTDVLKTKWVTGNDIDLDNIIKLGLTIDHLKMDEYKMLNQCVPYANWIKKFREMGLTFEDIRKSRVAYYACDYDCQGTALYLAGLCDQLSDICEVEETMVAALQNGNITIVEALWNKGLSVMDLEQYEEGLWLALHEGHWNIVQFYFDHGLRPKYVRDVLYIAGYYGKLEIIKKLIESGINEEHLNFSMKNIPQPNAKIYDTKIFSSFRDRHIPYLFKEQFLYNTEPLEVWSDPHAIVKKNKHDEIIEYYKMLNDALHKNLKLAKEHSIFRINILYRNIRVTKNGKESYMEQITYVVQDKLTKENLRRVILNMIKECKESDVLSLMGDKIIYMGQYEIDLDDILKLVTDEYTHDKSYHFEKYSWIIFARDCHPWLEMPYLYNMQTFDIPE